MQNYVSKKEAGRRTVREPAICGNGMDVCYAAFEQLGYKVKEEAIITAFAKAPGDEAATWAAKWAEQKPKFPSRTLCYLVSVTLQAPPALKMQQQENQQLDLEEHVSTAAIMIMKSRNREERAKELANINKGQDADRSRVLRLFLQSPCRNETLAHTRTKKCNSVQYCDTNLSQNKYMQ